MKKLYLPLCVIAMTAIIFCTAMIARKRSITEDNNNAAPTTAASEEDNAVVPATPDVQEPEAAQSVPNPAPVTTPAPAAYWTDIHNYNEDFPSLAGNGSFKNLTIQPGDTEGSLHITWYSLIGSGGSVEFEADNAGTNFSSGTSYTSTITPSVAVAGYYRNRAVVTGLAPNTSYHYRFGNGGSFSDTYSFYNASSEGTFAFTLVGDEEIGLGDEAELLDEHDNSWGLALNRTMDAFSNSSFYVSLGDQVANHSNPAEYDVYLDQPVLYTRPVMTLMGNHDYDSVYYGEHFYEPNQTAYGTAQGDDGDYWYRYGNTLFMVLNTSTVLGEETHETFVAETVAANPDTRWRVIFSHYSPVSNVEKYQGQADSIRDSFFYMQDEYDIDLFISGHDHSYSRSFVMQNYSQCSDGSEHSISNTPGALYVVMSTSTGCMYRDPFGSDYTAFGLQNNQPQIGQVLVSDNDLTINVYDADTFKPVDNYTIHKD